MRNYFFILFLFSQLLCEAQDSLQKRRFRIFDCVAYYGPVNYTRTHLSTTYISKFTDNQQLIAESQGYKALSYNETQGSSGFEFGLNASFKISGCKNPFFNRIKPRVYVHAGGTTFFDYSMDFQHTDVKDRLYYTDPSVPPLLIDSVTSGSLYYKYYSDQVFVELGANIDIITLRYFNFYAGFLVGQGMSTRNTFSIRKYESAEIAPYPGENSSKWVTLTSYSKKYTEAPSYITRFSIPIGMQHRFSNRRKYSIGIFTEMRPGIEIYKIKNGIRLTQKMMPITFGFRFSFCRHKDS